MGPLTYDPTHCTLCPRRCGGDRTQATGRCRMPDRPVVARAALHHWEEPPLSGTRGAGTVFFSGCSLGCVFCQNDSISQGDFGREIPVERLREIFRELAAQGAHNIDLVNPTHYAHAIAQALEAPLPVPVVWNSGGYDRVETLRALEGKVDIYLPDYKYPDAAGAKAYAGAADYPEVAQAAIREMVRQTGPCVFDGAGLLRRGVVIRHLLLPGRLAQAKAVMDWVAGTFPPNTVLFSLMSQYTPWGRAGDFPPLDRPLRRSEVRGAEAYFANLGLAGFTQGVEAVGAEYIPAFDLTGV
ncbi:radical SAM protein [Evtepia sp.]